MNNKITGINHFPCSGYWNIWFNFQNLIHCFPIISIFRSTPLLKSVSLQNVAYSFGRPIRNDSISKIEERISDRYFRNFLSINQMFGFFKFFLKVGILN